MKILVLYSEIGPYNIPVLKCLTEKYGAKIEVVCWDRARLKPYTPPPVPNVKFHARSGLDSSGIVDLALSLQPDVVYVSGWMDRGYFPAARLLKKRGIPVVTGFDDQWTGSARQRLGVLAFRSYYRRFFSHAWVAGPRQYEFARRLGFLSREIVHDMLSCDHARFAVSDELFDARVGAYPRVFLYVGNFRRVKGTDILIEAYTKYRHLSSAPWELVCAGNGDLRPLLERQPGVELLDFQPQEAVVRLCARAGAFVLPSRHDQWGVVVHEAAAAGLPLVLSEGVGAGALFLIEGYNGVRYAPNTSDALASAMERLAARAEAELVTMGRNSRKLAGRITPETSAANLVSVAR